MDDKIAPLLFVEEAAQDTSLSWSLIPAAAEMIMLVNMNHFPGMSQACRSWVEKKGSNQGGIYGHL